MVPCYAERIAMQALLEGGKGMTAPPGYSSVDG
jgi:hypothetical protein